MSSISTQHDAMATVSDMLAAHERFLRCGFADKTVTAAMDVLRRINAALPYGLPGTRSEYVAWLANPRWSRQTRKTYRDHLVRFGAWAVDPTDPWIDRDEAAGLPNLRVPPRLPRPATHEQARVCFTRTAQPWRLCCLLAGYGGVRPCEIARLHREDIDAEWINIHQGKGGRSRRVPTHRLVWRMVEPMPAGLLVRRPDGTPADPAWVSMRTAEVLRKRYRLAVSLYNLRHWYGTYVQEAQGDDRVTQELMGHASPVTTAGYTAVSDPRKRAAVEALPEFTG